MSCTLACITVTYHPDFALLMAQLDALPPQALKLWVDNSATPAMGDLLQRVAASRDDLVVLCNAENMGLAAAINAGVRWLVQHRPEVTELLLMDQDSEPLPGSVSTLQRALNALQAKGLRVAAVGPALRDVQTGLNHGFHQIRGWRWSRTQPESTAAPLPCHNLNGSGTLLPLAVYQQLGGLDARFFIDHVDTEWAFRAQAMGYGLYGVPAACFEHRMGASSRRIWLFGWRVWPERSAQRHFYLFRNAVRLLLTPHVPFVWKLWAVPKLVMTLFVTVFTDGQRWTQLSGMFRGIWAGLMPIPSGREE